MKGRLFGFILLGLVMLALTGCIGYVPFQQMNRVITVNEDMSGTLAVELAYTPSDYGLLQSSSPDPAASIGSQVANMAGWPSYKTEAYQEGGYQWVSTISEFSNVDEFYSRMSAATSDTTTGAGGTGTGAEWLPLYLGKEENLFVTRYTFTATLLAEAATNQNADFAPGELHVKLPGKIVETNGTVLPDGQTVTWQWGAYDYVPVFVTTQIVNTPAVVGTVIAVSCLCLLFLGVVAVVVFLIIRNNRSKAKPIS